MRSWKSTGRWVGKLLPIVVLGIALVLGWDANRTSREVSSIARQQAQDVRAAVVAVTSGTTASPSGLQPVGALPSAGHQFQISFDDEFNSNTIDTSKWNGDYANLQWCGSGTCSQKFNGLSINNSTLAVQATINYSNFSDNVTGRADMNSGGLMASSAKFSQRYGYFEWRAKLPHDGSGEGDGLWPALWALPIGKSSFPGGCTEGNEEADVVETVLSTSHMQQVGFNLHDYCFGQHHLTYPVTPVGDLSAAYHTYGLYWRNDGSPHGSMQVYFDGVPQGTPFVLDSRSNLWDNGIYILNQVIPCPPNNSASFLGGSACTSKTSSNNPLLVDYVRAWKEVPSASTSGSSDTTGPTVSLTAPANGATVSGSVTVTANASDKVGVRSVEIMRGLSSSTHSSGRRN